MNYSNLFYIALCSMTLSVTAPVLQRVITSLYFGIKTSDDYISVMPGLYSPGYIRMNPRKPNDLKNILIDMRTQICFYSENSTEIRVTGLQNPGDLFPESYIEVKGIPSGSVIYGASLWWEGNVRNNRAFANGLVTGEICLNPHTSATLVSLTISSRFKVGAYMCSKFRFTIADVLFGFQGNKTYTVRFQNMKSILSSLFFYGSWVMEVDFELP